MSEFFFSLSWINDKIDRLLALTIFGSIALDIFKNKTSQISTNLDRERGTQNAERIAMEGIIILNYTDIQRRHISSCRTLQN